MERTVKKTSYHMQVYEFIKQDILSGKLPCGARINEYNLAKEFGVSRSPVREAVRMLERDGFLVPGDNGAIVNPLEDKAVCDLYQTRMVLESFAARDGVGKMTAETLDELKRCIERCKQAHAVGDTDEVVAQNTRFHEILCSCCGNEMILQMISRQRDLSLLARRKEFFVYQKQQGAYLSEHEEIVHAIEQGRPEEVERCMRRHIGHDLAFYQKQLEEKAEKGAQL